jgi:C_GCAxxG_C_C family probable redox protein
MHMTKEEFVRGRVHEYYWEADLNCATTALKTLADYFSIAIHEQVIAAAVGMHGAGRFGAQCGLVEGALLFLGILGKVKGLSEEETVTACREFAGQFETRFGSLQCRILRPQGFKTNLPPHLCERLSNEALLLGLDFMTQKLTIP